MGLILTRRVGELLTIGDNVTVRVIGVKGNQVRLDVCAPKTVAVHREEIAERIKTEKGGKIGHKEAGRAPVRHAPDVAGGVDGVQKGGRTILRSNSLSSSVKP